MFLVFFGGAVFCLHLLFMAAVVRWRFLRRPGSYGAFLGGLFAAKLVALGPFFVFFGLVGPSFVDFISGVLFSFLLLALGLCFLWRFGFFSAKRKLLAQKRSC